MDGHHIRFSQQGIKVHKLCTHTVGDLLWDIGVIGEHVHIKAVSLSGDRLPYERTEL